MTTPVPDPTSLARIGTDAFLLMALTRHKVVGFRYGSVFYEPGGGTKTDCRCGWQGLDHTDHVMTELEKIRTVHDADVLASFPDGTVFRTVDEPVVKVGVTAPWTQGLAVYWADGSTSGTDDPVPMPVQILWAPQGSK